MVSDEPFMFSKVDHVLGTTDSYYLTTSSFYLFVATKDFLHIDSGGSLYFLTEEAQSTFIIKIASIGATSATRA